MSLDIGDPQGFGPMAALAGAAVAGAARHATVLPFLRRAIGSSVRTWVSGWLIGAVMVGTVGVLEAIYLGDDDWQYLATIMLGYVIVIAWSIAGAVVGVASLVRPKLPAIEPIVHSLLCAAVGVAVALWVWFVAFVIPMSASVS